MIQLIAQSWPAAAVSMLLLVAGSCCLLGTSRVVAFLGGLRYSLRFYTLSAPDEYVRSWKRASERPEESSGNILIVRGLGTLVMAFGIFIFLRFVI